LNRAPVKDLQNKDNLTAAKTLLEQFANGGIRVETHFWDFLRLLQRSETSVKTVIK
jgi:hypothetical protein